MNEKDFFRKAQQAKASRFFRAFRVHVYINHRFQDFRDINHERKRDYPLNLCNLCSKKRKTLQLSDFAFGKVKLKS